MAFVTVQFYITTIYYNYISFIFQITTGPDYLLAIFIPYCSLSSTIAALYFCSLKLRCWWTGKASESKLSILPSYQSDFADFIPFETFQMFGDRTIHMLWFRALQFMGVAQSVSVFFLILLSAWQQRINWFYSWHMPEKHCVSLQSQASLRPVKVIVLAL